MSFDQKNNFLVTLTLWLRRNVPLFSCSSDGIGYLLVSTG